MIFTAKAPFFFHGESPAGTTSCQPHWSSRQCNLLDDQLVDVLLDSAAGGVNTVEREGVSRGPGVPGSNKGQAL